MRCFYPGRCPICNNIQLDTSCACMKCKKELIYIVGATCMRCGKPLMDDTEEYCHDCRTRRFHFIKGFALWVYEGPIKESLFQYKYKGKKEYAQFYVNEMVKHLSKKILAIKPDALIPIPIHKSKKRYRGYNQAEILANELGKQLQIPVIPDLLLRDKRTLAQKTLSDKERFYNLKEAFIYHDNMGEQYIGKLDTVILVDDIYTTGSTMEACTRILQVHHIRNVYFVVLCIGKGL